jgi:Pyocin activator protein PrtN
MNTTFLLVAQYSGAAVIPVETVCQDYFSHLTPEKFVRKCLAGEIDLPIVQMEKSQKSMRGVPLTDLAAYLDKHRSRVIIATSSACHRGLAASRQLMRCHFRDTFPDTTLLSTSNHLRFLVVDITPQGAYQFSKSDRLDHRPA